MDLFFAFVLNHWVLFSIFVVLLVMVVTLEMGTTVGGAPRLNPGEAIQAMNNDQALVLDIRQSEAYQQGHIIGAKLFDADNLSQVNTVAPKKSARLIISCDNGEKSAKLAATLLKDGYENTRFLAGGIKAWREANLPLVKGK